MQASVGRNTIVTGERSRSRRVQSSSSSARRPNARSLGLRVAAAAPKDLGTSGRIAELKNGKVTSGPDLSIEVDGMKLPNPFVIGSGPPGTNYTVMKKAFDEGWGGVICKTLSLDSSKVVNVTPRYAKLTVPGSREVLGWSNIELISDRKFEVMLDELKQLKQEYPDRILIASIMEEYNKGAWEEIIGRCEEVGIDGFEINFSCPHGMPERRMGMAMGQDCELLTEVCGWIHKAAKKPVWAKMTPNITDITQPARCALAQGMEGVAAINTIQSVMGVNMDSLRPEPCVEGYSTPAGYSARAVKPIALAKVMAISQMIRREYGGKRSVSGIGGVETGRDAAEFILLGSSTVQVCTGVMVHGYPVVKRLCGELQEFMEFHKFKSLGEFVGHSLPYFTTHSDLVAKQKAAIAEKRGQKKGLANDKDWTGEGFVKETESMVSNA